MIRKVASILAAAAGASLLVAILPDFTSGVSARTAQPERSTSAIASDTSVNAQDAGSRDRKSGCVQTWPYYEQACLRGSRTGDAQTVRIIAVNRPGLSQAGQTRR